MSQKIPWGEFSLKHKEYIRNALKNRMCVAEGAIRSGKTIDHSGPAARESLVRHEEELSATEGHSAQRQEMS